MLDVFISQFKFSSEIAMIIFSGLSTTLSRDIDQLTLTSSNEYAMTAAPTEALRPLKFTELSTAIKRFNYKLNEKNKNYFQLFKFA